MFTELTIYGDNLLLYLYVNINRLTECTIISEELAIQRPVSNAEQYSNTATYEHMEHTAIPLYCCLKCERIISIT